MYCTSQERLSRITLGDGVGASHAWIMSECPTILLGEGEKSMPQLETVKRERKLKNSEIFFCMLLLRAWAGQFYKCPQKRDRSKETAE